MQLREKLVDPTGLRDDLQRATENLDARQEDAARHNRCACGCSSNVGCTACLGSCWPLRVRKSASLCSLSAACCGPWRRCETGLDSAGPNHERERVVSTPQDVLVMASLRQSRSKTVDNDLVTFLRLSSAGLSLY